VVPLIVYLAILAWLAERFATTQWARFYMVAAGGFATLVSPFLITFNNHTVATASAAIALYATVRILNGAGAWYFAVAGLAAGFTACNELPAASLALGLGVFLLYKAPRQTLLYFLPAALFPVAALLAANSLQLGQLRPAYAEFGGPWYEYEGSHWRVPPGQLKRGIDFAGRNGETKAMYAFHLLLGHHGLFALTPIMLLALAGMGMQVWRVCSRLTLRPPLPSGGEGEKDTPLSPSLGEGYGGEGRPAGGEGPLLGLFAFLVSVVVIAFYIVKTDNYGGWSNGPRWLMWLTPLWLIVMLPVLDRLHRHWAGRALALALLALSIASMSYQQWNPWRHPWIYNWMESRDWIAY
jgi:hypothetical protein